MTTVLLESPLSLFGEGRPSGPAGGPGITLEELLDATLRSAGTHAAVECPVCHAEMHADNGAVRCSGCGSTLS
jgi:hypothetical protein